MDIIRTLVLTGCLLVTATAIGSATTKSAAATKAGHHQYITCPITHDKVLKSKAIKVTSANGKTTYVCCSDCVAAAKKKLMAKK